MRIFGFLAAFVISFAATAAELSQLSDRQVANGLKEALSQSSVAAVTKLGRENGFLGNEKVRISLPEPLRSAEGVLRTFGQGERVDQLVTAMNRAAEAAVPEARALLLDAVKKMSIRDAKDILTGGDSAATDYFRRTTEAQLRERFLPIVDRATGKLDVTEQYNQLAGRAANFGLLKDDQANLQGYVTQKALDGLFLVMAEEEKAIRENPVERTGYWLKKVFGTLGQ